MVRGFDSTGAEACQGDNPPLFFVPGNDQPELPARGRKETKLVSRLLQEACAVDSWVLSPRVTQWRHFL